jgi:hypothetical protein
MSTSGGLFQKIRITNWYLREQSSSASLPVRKLDILGLRLRSERLPFLRKTMYLFQHDTEDRSCLDCDFRTRVYWCYSLSRHPVTCLHILWDLQIQQKAWDHQRWWRGSLEVKKIKCYILQTCSLRLTLQKLKTRIFQERLYRGAGLVSNTENLKASS